jgi:hypothetical protein
MKTVTIQAQQRWDYCFETRKTETALLNALNRLGQEGWDLVEVLYYKDLKGIMTWTAFMKRPSLGQAPAPGQPAAAAAGLPTARPLATPAETPGFDLDGEDFQVKPE